MAMILRNQVFHGDCVQLLDQVRPNSVDLIYLDPPFYTQKEQRLSTRDGKKLYAFSDRWKSVDQYQQFLRVRLEKCRNVLKNTGSLFLHCDRTASHRLRLELDAVFGPENFRSEIIWSYRRWSNSKKGLLNTHQVIFFYSKTTRFKFNPLYGSYSPATNVDQIVQERARDARGKSRYRLSTDGRPILVKEKKGVPLGDVWEIPFLNPKAKERCGYPTQKPVLLLERIIQLTTKAGDLVLDPFCGSGTTLVAAKLLGRQYLGMDISAKAIVLSRKRLHFPRKTESRLLQNGKEVYFQQDKETIGSLEALGATIVQRNKGIDGFISSSEGLIPIKVRKKGETVRSALDKLNKASQKNRYKTKILLA